MGFGHNHDHTGGHTGVKTATGEHRRRLMLVLAIYVFIIIVQLIGSVIGNSLALRAEALHMTVDASGILIALLAAFFATKAASKLRTYGYMRAEIVAVLINCLLLFVLGGYILFEAVDRWRNPSYVDGGVVIGFAVVGLIGAATSLFILSRGAKESLNVKAAFLEVMSDGIGAAGIIISGILNITLGWNRADAIAAAAVGVIILPRAFMLLKQAINLILQGVPADIDIDEVRQEIMNTEGVSDLHSLHVWGLTSGVSVMSAHVVLERHTLREGRSNQVLDALTVSMRENFHIEHCTIQFEEPGHLEHEGSLHRQLAGFSEAHR